MEIETTPYGRPLLTSFAPAESLFAAACARHALARRLALDDSGTRSTRRKHGIDLLDPNAQRVAETIKRARSHDPRSSWRTGSKSNHSFPSRSMRTSPSAIPPSSCTKIPKRATPVTTPANSSPSRPRRNFTFFHSSSSRSAASASRSSFEQDSPKAVRSPRSAGFALWRAARRARCTTRSGYRRIGEVKCR